jgi:hypothetical protein
LIGGFFAKKNEEREQRIFGTSHMYLEKKKVAIVKKKRRVKNQRD